jgi:hypothetical protein
MGRGDWVVLVTEPAKEYAVRNELRRRDTDPYLPQSRCRYRWGSGALIKLRPSFPRVVLLPAIEAAPIVLDGIAGVRER